MKTDPGDRKIDLQTYFEVFLLLAAILTLTGRLGALSSKSKPVVDQKSSSPSAYIWGRGEEGQAGLFMAAKEVRPEPMPERVKLLFHRPMDINKVSEKLLQTVPGIGSELAARIVSHRDHLGHFSQMEELLEINGIGSSKLQRLSDYLTVGDPVGAANQVVN